MADSKREKIPELNRLNILYVEDDSDTRVIVFNLLIDLVSVVYTAENGKEGLELFQQQKPDIVITGIKMPEMNGLEMVHEIKKINPEVPIMILTSENEEGYFLQAIDLGVEKYLKKPVDPNQLLTSLYQLSLSLYQRSEINAKNEIIRTVLDSHPDFMMICQGRNIHYMNVSFQQFLNINPEQMNEQQISILDPYLVFPDNSILENISFYEVLKHASFNSGEMIIYLLNKKDDSVHTFLLHTKQIPNYPEVLISLIDITEIDKEKKFFHELAMKDPLTGAYNRNRFNSNLENEIERSLRYNHPLSLIIFDIDYFKKFNDEFGHPVGDKILINLSKLIKSNIRITDIFARYGGEEFIILLPETSIKKAAVMAENLRKLIEFNSAHNPECPKQITCSFGVTELHDDDSSETIIKRVDDALYRAKNAGRNRVEEG
ncbi:MAG: diguanylate cyclase [Spirochaetia bacterium]|nr:diguanylate cyclase [Spirochaetia bacterium]